MWRCYTEMRLSKGFHLKYYLDNLMENVFSKSWDDIWLTFDVAISQRAILLRNRKNYIIQIKNLKENDEYFNLIFNKFCTYSLDSEILTELVQYIVSSWTSPLQLLQMRILVIWLIVFMLLYHIIYNK